MPDYLVTNEVHADLLKAVGGHVSSAFSKTPPFTHLRTLYAAAKAIHDNKDLVAAHRQLVSQIIRTDAGTTVIDKDGTFVSLTADGSMRAGRMWVVEAVNPALPQQRDTKVYI